MDEQRLNAYIQLIQAILGCDSGEEMDILQANPELVDAGFVQVMRAEADKRAQQGRGNAGWLRNFAQKIETANYELPRLEIKLTADALLQQGFQQYQHSEYPQAWESLQQSLALYEAIGDKANIALCWGQLGCIERDRGNWDEAERLFQQSLVLRTELGDRSGMATSWGQLGDIQRNRGNWDEAERLFQQSLVLRTELGDKAGMATSWGQLGDIQRNRGNWDEAERLYQQSLALRTELGDNTEIMGFYNELMDDETLLQLADELIFAETGKHLSNRERVILRGRLERKTYAEIANDLSLTENYARRVVAASLWNQLSQSLGKKVTTENIRITLLKTMEERYVIHQSQAHVALLFEGYVKEYEFYQNICSLTGHDRYDEIERRINQYEFVLENCPMRTDLMSERWATIQIILGNCFLYRLKGERYKNIEQSIVCYKQASEFFLKKSFPENWAAIQHNLGTAYFERIVGDPSKNLEVAISCYYDALSIYNSDAHSQDWAMTINNLGNAYSNRVKGNQEENLEKAIGCYKQALNFYRDPRCRQQFAMVQNNLGNAYYDRIIGRKDENLRQAIKCYQLALDVRTYKDLPEQWAMTHNNLGNAYSNLENKEQENLNLAIAAYKAALQVYTKVAYPEQWAMVQNNLGNAYSNLTEVDWEKNAKLAIVHYKAALEIRTPSSFPLDCLRTATKLGNFAYDRQDWQTAIEGYEAAITAVETSCTFAESYQEKQKRRTAQIGVYEKLVQACINSGDIGRALASVERSKSRNLIELLANRDIYPKGDIPPEILTQLDTLRREVTAKQQLLETLERPTKTDSPLDTNLGQGRSSSSPSLTLSAIETIRQEYQEAEQKLNQLLDIIKTYDPTFSLTQRVEPIKFSEIQGLLDEHTALIEWYCTRERIYAFVVTGEDGGISFQVSTPEAYTQLQELRQTYLDTYAQKKSDWEEQFNHYLHRLADILHISELIAPLTDKYRQLILVPYRDLHLFPLHILPLDNSSKPQYLADKFADGVKYAPSCQFLQVSRRNRKDTSNNTSPRFFAIQNPTEDLAYADLEVQAISPAFQPHARILPQKAASKAALKETATAQDFQGAEYIHFAGHGAFNFVSPLLSPLVLAGAVVKREDGQTESLPRENHPEPEPEPELTGNSRYIPWRKGKTLDLTLCYTLGELFQLDLPYCRLVILSACETGLMDFSPQLEEYISLGLGFLYAGAPNVICSLWAVNDLSTAILMVKFYEEMANQPSVAIALKAAQQWMRTVTKQKLTEWLNPPAGDLNAPVKQKIADNVDFDLRPSDYQPYQHPFHWAAFCAIGI